MKTGSVFYVVSCLRGLSAWGSVVHGVPFRLTNADGCGLTAVGGNEPRICQGDVTNLMVAAHDTHGRAAWKTVFQPQTPRQGAHIYYCYRDGKLTDKRL